MTDHPIYFRLSGGWTLWKITRHVGHFVKIADITFRKIYGNAAFPASHWLILFDAFYWTNSKAFRFIAFCALCFYAGRIDNEIGLVISCFKELLAEFVRSILFTIDI